jgi:REP element-mobilizing transposase RayT
MPAHAAAMLAALRTWHAEHDGSILAATVMPDHAHVLFELGQLLTVGQCIARWKSTVRREMNYPGEWQRDFWEHRLRPAERAEDYALYVFMNPYRAGLIPPSEKWAAWWLPDPGLFRFSSELNTDGTPPSTWVDLPNARFAHLATGKGQSTTRKPGVGERRPYPETNQLTPPRGATSF